jgi:hypothetical protein
MEVCRAPYTTRMARRQAGRGSARPVPSPPPPPVRSPPLPVPCRPAPAESPAPGPARAPQSAGGSPRREQCRSRRPTPAPPAGPAPGPALRAPVRSRRPPLPARRCRAAPTALRARRRPSPPVAARRLKCTGCYACAGVSCGGGGPQGGAARGRKTASEGEKRGKGECTACPTLRVPAAGILVGFQPPPPPCPGGGPGGGAGPARARAAGLKTRMRAGGRAGWQAGGVLRPPRLAAGPCSAVPRPGRGSRARPGKLIRDPTPFLLAGGPGIACLCVGVWRS